MGREARARRKEGTLPREEWWCIWCDRRPPMVTFDTREHVIPESLGGARDFRLKRGLVCDACNRGVLQKFDEELNLVAPLRGMRALGMLGPHAGQLSKGIRIDADGNGEIDTTRLSKNDEVKLHRNRDGSGTLEITSGGPTEKVLGDHLTRGLHRIAYNCVAHKYGAAGVRPRLEFLRNLVLDLPAISHRAHLALCRTPTPDQRAMATASRYEIQESSAGVPELVALFLGPFAYVVSVAPTTRALADQRRQHPDFQVYAEID